MIEEIKFWLLILYVIPCIVCYLILLLSTKYDIKDYGIRTEDDSYWGLAFIFTPAFNIVLILLFIFDQLKDLIVYIKSKIKVLKIFTFLND